jgi:lycopene beta-cyclase
VDRLQYLALMGTCLLVTLPLELALGARVYRCPRRLLATLAVVFVVFFSWDAIAIARGTWSFSPEYVTGWRLPLNVPVEEATFFVVIPICALLTYEAVGRLLRSSRG